jgi:Endopolygalacturonase
MANRYCNLDNDELIMDSFDEINTGFDQVQSDLDTKTGVNVADYGAVGDGSDETADIQDAINVAIGGSGIVFFPRGTYNANTLANLNSVQLVGENATLFVNGEEYKINPVARTEHSQLMYSRATSEIDSLFQRRGLTRALAAIQNGTIKIMYWGDSITEGADILNTADVYANRLDENIRTALRGITVISANYSLGGRYTTQTIDPNYKGLPSEPPDPASGFYRPWSVVGQSWNDAVKSFAPDLIIYAFGMNDPAYNPGNADKIIADNLQTLLTGIRTWNPAPSLVLVPTMLPTKDHSLYSQSQNMTRAAARSFREFGKNNGIPVADAGRLFEILRDGYDDVTRQTVLRETNFQGYNTSAWSGDKSGFTLSGGVLTPINTSPRFVTRERTFYNGVIQVDIRPVNSTDTAWIDYRSDNLGKLSVFVTPGANGAGSIGLYRGDTGTLIQNVTGLTIPFNQYRTIRIEVNGSRHTVYFNGTKIMDNVISYHKLSNGKVSLGSNQSSVVYANLVIMYADPLSSDAAYSERDLLSTMGINHPSPLGHAVAYLPAFTGLVRRLSD